MLAGLKTANVKEREIILGTLSPFQRLWLADACSDETQRSHIIDFMVEKLVIALTGDDVSQKAEGLKLIAYIETNGMGAKKAILSELQDNTEFQKIKHLV